LAAVSGRELKTRSILPDNLGKLNQHGSTELEASEGPSDDRNPVLQQISADPLKRVSLHETPAESERRKKAASPKEPQRAPVGRHSAEPSDAVPNRTPPRTLLGRWLHR
jgi:hypothetical protein